MTCPVVKPLIRVHKLVSFLNPALMAENFFMLVVMFLCSVSLLIMTKFLAVMYIIQSDINVC